MLAVRGQARACVSSSVFSATTAVAATARLLTAHAAAAQLINWLLQLPMTLIFI